MTKFLFKKTLIIGVGLIGSSLSRALKSKKISKKVIGYDRDIKVRKKCAKLKFLDSIIHNLDLYENYDLIVLATPLGSYNEILERITPYIKSKCIITDVGSTKYSVQSEFNRYKKNEFINFIPGHPVAGLEKSGPEYGFEDLFLNRYCILTSPNKRSAEYKLIKKMWEKIGMTVENMSAEHHDRVLAMPSHIPQLIAYSIVATSPELESKIKKEVIKYSAAGFRDFTRLAGSDPIMWRDIYMLNKDAVLEMLGRFSEDLSSLQKAIRNSDSNFLEKMFSETREVRKQIEKFGQAGTFDPREKNN